MQITDISQSLQLAFCWHMQYAGPEALVSMGTMIFEFFIPKNMIFLALRLQKWPFEPSLEALHVAKYR